MVKLKYKVTEKFTEEVISEILEIKDKKGLTASTLLESAKKKKSKLYDMFEWEDSIAGEKWRLHQARLLINEVKIIVEDKEMYAFENISVSVDSKEGIENSREREYKPIIEIMNNEDYRKQLVSRALEEVNYWKERHSELSELVPIFNSIKNFEEKWQKKKK